jgi:hypothetical protein
VRTWTRSRGSSGQTSRKVARSAATSSRTRSASGSGQAFSQALIERGSPGARAASSRQARSTTSSSDASAASPPSRWRSRALCASVPRTLASVCSKGAGSSAQPSHASRSSRVLVISSCRRPVAASAAWTSVVGQLGEPPPRAGSAAPPTCSGSPRPLLPPPEQVGAQPLARGCAPVPRARSRAGQLAQVRVGQVGRSRRPPGTRAPGPHRSRAGGSPASGGAAPPRRAVRELLGHRTPVETRSRPRGRPPPRRRRGRGRAPSSRQRGGVTPRGPEADGLGQLGHQVDPQGRGAARRSTGREAEPRSRGASRSSSASWSRVTGIAVSRPSTSSPWKATAPPASATRCRRSTAAAAAGDVTSWWRISTVREGRPHPRHPGPVA